MSHENTSLQSSVTVLVTIFVMLDQDYQSLFYYSNNLQEESLKNDRKGLPEKEEALDHAISDSLWFMIIIRSCSFLDEWDRILGVRNEPIYLSQINRLKKITSSARKAINSWTELKKFRNEITAHNFRGKNQIVTINQMDKYDSPQTIEELYFLICFISRMTQTLIHIFPDEANNVIEFSNSNATKPLNEPTSERWLMFNTLLKKVDADLSNHGLNWFRKQKGFRLYKQIDQT